MTVEAIEGVRRLALELRPRRWDLIPGFSARSAGRSPSGFLENLRPVTHTVQGGDRLFRGGAISIGVAQEVGRTSPNTPDDERAILLIRCVKIG